MYTGLAIVRTYNEIRNTAPMVFPLKVLEAACTTVNYAPMLSVLFLGPRSISKIVAFSMSLKQFKKMFSNRCLNVVR